MASAFDIRRRRGGSKVEPRPFRFGPGAFQHHHGSSVPFALLEKPPPAGKVRGILRAGVISRRKSPPDRRPLSLKGAATRGNGTPGRDCLPAPCAFPYPHPKEVNRERHPTPIPT